jgi:hypothetical protein
MTFYWEFIDEGTTYNESGDNGAEFNKVFSHSGEHFVILTVSINPSGSTDTRFNINLNNVCVNGLWYEDGIPYDGEETPDICKGLNGLIGGGDDCCPDEYACKENQDGKAYCIYNVSEVKSCSDYENSTACEDDELGVADNSLFCGGIRRVSGACGVYLGTNYVADPTSCGCFWDSDECKQKEEIAPEIQTDDFDPSDKHTCIKSIQKSDCLNGIMQITIANTIQWSGEVSQAIKDACADDLCPSSTKEISCGEPIVKLPGFSLINILAAALLLTVFYLYTLKKKAN